MKIAWSGPAKRDLDAILLHIAAHDPEAAMAVCDRIEEAVCSLSRHPRLGRPGRIDGTRELVVTGTPYVVPYRIRAATVEVLAIFHGARKWPIEL